MLEMAGDFHLPSSGKGWRSIRDPDELKKILVKTNKSQDLQDLICLLMNPDPKMRPSVNQILEHHRFLAFFLQKDPSSLSRKLERITSKLQLDEDDLSVIRTPDSYVFI